MMPTFGSLFAGIGGIDLGLERAGMRCLWQVEIDDYCTRVLEKHWPNIERFRDVRECGRHNLRPVDLVAGGFPCQPHSVAGKRRGAEDDRNLWPEFSRIIAELRPRYVLAENVPGIITTYLDTVLSDLEDLGYACATLNLPAVAFDAPHRRERIFIVAHRVGVGWTEGASERVQSEVEQSEGPKPQYICKSIPEVGNVAHADQSRLAQWQGQRSHACQKQQAIVGSSRETNVAHSTSIKSWESPNREGGEDIGRRGIDCGGGESKRAKAVADAKGQFRDGRDDHSRGRPQSASKPGDGLEEVRSAGSWWAIEPNVGGTPDGLPDGMDRLGNLTIESHPSPSYWADNWERNTPRVANGIPHRVDRLRGLGNAVVPQVVEWVGRRIIEYMEDDDDTQGARAS